MPRKKPDGEKPLAVAEDDFNLGEGTCPYAEAGCMISDNGFLDCVTDIHRAKARAYFAKIEAEKLPPIEQSLF